MPTTYTSSIGLALPQTGELSGTWGDTLNDYITRYVDAAVAGTQTISGSQTAVTLSTTNGSALSQAGTLATGSAQYFIINCTGNPATTLTITAPAVSKTYVVINSTSSNQNVNIIGAGPTTGVTVAAGDKALVAWNGSDFVRIGASAGGANTQVQYNNGGNLAGSANLTFNGTTLTANTLNLTNALGAAHGGTGLTSFTTNSVFYASGTTTVAQSANLTFDGTILTADTITGKLKAYSEAVTTATVSTSTYNIDTSATNIFDLTLANNVTFTFTNPPTSGTSRSVTVILRQDATGNRTASFTNAKYSDGILPVLSTGANQVDVLTFFTVNGGTFWFGTFAMANVS